jgi:hypothetical protein
MLYQVALKATLGSFFEFMPFQRLGKNSRVFQRSFFMAVGIKAQIFCNHCGRAQATGLSQDKSWTPQLLPGIAPNITQNLKEFAVPAR